MGTACAKLSVPRDAALQPLMVPAVVQGKRLPHDGALSELPAEAPESAEYSKEYIYAHCVSYSAKMLELQEAGFYVTRWEANTVTLRRKRPPPAAHRFAHVKTVWMHGAQLELGATQAHTSELVTRDIVACDRDIRAASLTLRLRDGIETYECNGAPAIVCYYDPDRIRRHRAQ